MGKTPQAPPKVIPKAIPRKDQLVNPNRLPSAPIASEGGVQVVLLVQAPYIL